MDAGGTKTCCSLPPHCRHGNASQQRPQVSPLVTQSCFLTATTNIQSHLLLSLVSLHRKQGAPPVDTPSPDVLSDRKCVSISRRHKRSIRCNGARALAETATSNSPSGTGVNLQTPKFIQAPARTFRLPSEP